MKKVLVLGASGFIGKTLCQILSSDYEVYGTYHENKIKPEGTMMVKLDLSVDDSILNVLSTVEPDVVISSLRGDFAYQMEAHRYMASWLKEKGSRLFYLSTANVFDGKPNKAHGESEPTGSVSDYGKFKIKCEEMLHKELGPLVTILRLPMVFGNEAKRVHDIREGLKRGGPLIVQRDFYLTLHLDTVLAKQIAYLIENDISGVLHLGSQDVVGYDVAMSMLKKQLGHEHVKLIYERIQDQPYYLALKTEKSVLPIDLMVSAEQVVEAIE